jgi:hypothetical protein
MATPNESRVAIVDGDQAAGKASGRPKEDRPGRPPVWVVGIVGLGITVGIVLRLLIPAGMDATIFLAFGEDATTQTSYAERLLGDVSTRDNLGHDGKYFFIQANDPLHLDPERNAAFLDRPLYRSQRMLYPLIAGGLGLFPAWVIVWMMLITNVVCLWIGTLFGAKLARLGGASAWLGLAVPLNIGLLFELWIGGSGILAYVLCLGAVLALSAKKEWSASVLFTAAALSRETILVFAFGILVLGWLEHRRVVWRLVSIPLAGVAIWHGYLQARLMGIPGGRDAWPLLGPPFVGLVDSLGSWVRDPTYLTLNLIIVVVLVIFVARGVRHRSTIVWGALPFVALATVLTAYVWREPFDISRALVPVFTAAPFLLFVPADGGRLGFPVTERA